MVAVAKARTDQASSPDKARSRGKAASPDKVVSRDKAASRDKVEAVVVSHPAVSLSKVAGVGDSNSSPANRPRSSVGLPPGRQKLKKLPILDPV